MGSLPERSHFTTRVSTPAGTILRYASAAAKSSNASLWGSFHTKLTWSRDRTLKKGNLRNLRGDRVTLSLHIYSVFCKGNGNLKPANVVKPAPRTTRMGTGFGRSSAT